MSTDPFITELQAGWRTATPDTDHLAKKVHRYRRLRALSQWSEAAGALTALAFGLWFAFMAWQQADWAYGLGSVALLVATPLIVTSIIRGRRAFSQATSRTPYSTLLEARHHAETTIDAMRRARWAAWLLFTASAVGAVLAAMGLANDLGWPVLAWLVTALAALLGTRLREQQMCQMRDRCDQLLSDWKSLDEA